MVVNVAVGVIQRDNAVFITRRDASQHQGDKWEFPGGKVEPGESPAVALNRELDEEVGIRVARAAPMMVLEHDYGDKQVCLHIYHVTAFDGEPRSQEGLAGRWAPIVNLKQYRFPDANTPILTQLQRQLPET